MTKVPVTILGQTFTLRGEASASEIRQIAEFVNAQIAEVAAQGRSADSLNVALLALLNVAGLYLRQSGRDQASEDVIAARLERLLARLEAATMENSSGS